MEESELGKDVLYGAACIIDLFTTRPCNKTDTTSESDVLRSILGVELDS